MNIDGVNINYVRYGNKNGTPLVLLHGWGQNIEMMKPVGDYFVKTNDIVILDLPGYGKSSEPPFAWTVEDYANMVKKVLDKLKIEKPILIGHSFGGKISLYYASLYPVEKLILFASPYRKEIKNVPLKVKILKKLKKVPFLNKFENFAKKHIGSTDYKNASPRMREILVKTVNLDITENVKKITSPTLIFWGTNDQAVNIQSAYELESLIKDAGVVVYEGATHYAYLEHLTEVVRVIKTFLR
jgi:pimeloyl-ACP methyl ester carboxylesterase